MFKTLLILGEKCIFYANNKVYLDVTEHDNGWVVARAPCVLGYNQICFLIATLLNELKCTSNVKILYICRSYLFLWQTFNNMCPVSPSFLKWHTMYIKIFRIFGKKTSFSQQKATKTLWFNQNYVLSYSEIDLLNIPCMVFKLFIFCIRNLKFTDNVCNYSANINKLKKWTRNKIKYRKIKYLSLTLLTK